MSLDRLNNVALLIVSRQGGPDSQKCPYRYTFLDPGVARGPSALAYTVEVDERMVRDTVDRLSAIATTSWDPQELQRKGALLCRLLFPARRGLEGLRRRIQEWDGALMVQTDENLVPWELLHDGAEFLGLRLAVGHQAVTTNEHAPGRVVTELRRALFVSNPTEDLKDAAMEAEKLVESLEASGIRCDALMGAEATRREVQDRLADGEYDLFHYAGHIVTADGDEGALRLQGGDLSAHAIADILGDDAPPLVVLSGCSSVGPLRSAGGAFMEAGARVIVGTRFRVSDRGARAVTEAFYAQLRTGTSAGASLRAARRSLSHTPEGSWAAFVLFGDPTATFWPIAEPTAEPEPGPESVCAAEPSAPTAVKEGRARAWWRRHGFPGELQPPAAGVVDRMITRADAIGMVTSWHLAVGLLEAGPSELTEAAEREGLDPPSLVALLSVSFRVGEGQDGAPRPAPPPERDIEASDSAEKTFRAAGRLAAEAGRPVTLDDLVHGFALTGGGSAGQALTMLGISLETVRPRLREAASSSIFLDDDRLDLRLLDPQTLVGLRMAKLFGTSQDAAVLTPILLLGFALASSEVLREALSEQAEAGGFAVRRLFDDVVDLSRQDFSFRSRAGLEAALRIEREAGSATVGPAAVLAGILRQPGNGAQAMLAGLGIDTAKLLAALEPRAADDGPASASRADGPGPAGGA